MNKPWPFRDAENTAVFTSKRIVDGRDWIHYVTHDAEDGAWQFHPYGGPTPVDEAAVIGLRTVLSLDDSLRELADLPCGWHAWRQSESSAWTRAPMKLKSR
jgi:hypothetical protein